MKREDGRTANELRPVTIKKNFIKHAEGSVLITVGHTKVICNASVEEKVPPFLRDQKQGWVTAEYSMLPYSTLDRKPRDISRGKLDGRSQEIQRLIGRSLRSVIDFELLGERTILIDADVLQADGGTRTAAITGSFVALADLIQKLLKNGTLYQNPIRDYVAAISVGIVNSKVMLDLKYDEDSSAQMDMNVVMVGKGNFVEVQGTAEGKPFSKEEMDDSLALAQKGIEDLIAIQKEGLGGLEFS